MSANTSTRSVEGSEGLVAGFPVVRRAVERTVRLVSTARLRPPVLADLVPPELLDALAEIEGATSGRLNGQWRGTSGVEHTEFVYNVPHANFINATFCYARPGAPNRFNGENRGAWYAALDVNTCLAEVRFHITRELSNIGEYNTRVDYAEMFASFAGDFLEIAPGSDHPCLHPDPAIGYPAGNAVADAARANGISLLSYPSVRSPGGTCFAALSPNAVQSVAQGGVWEMVWSGTPEPKIAAV